MDLEKLYRDYYTIVFRYALSITRDGYVAEEIAQEAFLKAMRKIDSFRGECDISVWLCQIAKNEYFQYLKRQKKRMKIAEDGIKVSCESPEKEVLARETALLVMDFLQNMENPYRDVFFMRMFRDMPFRTIGEHFGREETWARVTFYRARKKIKEVVEHEDSM